MVDGHYYRDSYQCKVISYINHKKPLQHNVFISTAHTYELNATNGDNTNWCNYCNANPTISSCRKFNNLTLTKVKLISLSRTGYASIGHTLKMCKSNIICRLCGRRHRMSIHISTAAMKSSSTNNSSNISRTEVLLPVMNNNAMLSDLNKMFKFQFEENARIKKAWGNQKSKCPTSYGTKEIN